MQQGPNDNQDKDNQDKKGYFNFNFTLPTFPKFTWGQQAAQTTEQAQETVDQTAGQEMEVEQDRMEGVETIGAQEQAPEQAPRRFVRVRNIANRVREGIVNGATGTANFLWDNKGTIVPTVGTGFGLVAREAINTTASSVPYGQFILGGVIASTAAFPFVFGGKKAIEKTAEYISDKRKKRTADEAQLTDGSDLQAEVNKGLEDVAPEDKVEEIFTEAPKSTDDLADLLLQAPVQQDVAPTFNVDTLADMLANDQHVAIEQPQAPVEEVKDNSDNNPNKRRKTAEQTVAEVEITLPEVNNEEVVQIELDLPVVEEEGARPTRAQPKRRAGRPRKYGRK